ncbi:MAG: MFS transporter [Actinomycetota bacterium]
MSAKPESPPRAGLILAALIASAAVANMNLAVANVTLPTIGRDLEATQTALNLVAVGFTLGLAASVLYLGAVADRYGRYRMLIGGLALSIPAALIAGFAPDVQVLALGRLVGGIAAGMAFPTTLSIIADLFSGAAKTRAIALWTGIGCGASALAPAAAGYLLEVGSWGWAFLMTIPLAALALVLVVAVVPRGLPRDTRPDDHLGGVLSVVAVGAVTLGLHFVSVPGELAVGLVALGVSAVGFALFAWRQLRAPNPLFDLAIAARPTFWVAGVTGTIVFGSLIGAMFVGQQYVQNVMGYTTLQAGLSALPMAATMILISPVAAIMIARLGTRTTLSAGIVVVLAGTLLLFTWRADSSYLPVGLAYAVIGIGIGMAGTPASRSIMASVPERRAGMGSGMTDLQRDLGAAIMQSLVGAVLTVQYAASVDRQLAAAPAAVRDQVTEQTAAVLRQSFGGAQILAEQYPTYADAILRGASEAFGAGSAWGVAVAAALVAVGLVVALVRFPHRARELELEADYAREQDA